MLNNRRPLPPWMLPLYCAQLSSLSTTLGLSVYNWLTEWILTYSNNTGVTLNGVKLKDILILCDNFFLNNDVSADWVIECQVSFMSL